jgi:hypothetical protein
MGQKTVSAFNLRLLVEVALILCVLILLISSSIPTQAAPAAVVSRSASLQAANFWYTCSSVVDVEVFTNRVAVHCSLALPPPGSPTLPAGVLWFAVSSFDNTAASRFLSLFQTALLSGKTLNLYLDPNDTSGAAWGCLAAECRTLNGATILP